jgi:uncharacterized protein (DUF697 family)/tellurite resistance protein
MNDTEQNDNEQQALLSIALMAALADGSQNDAERDHIAALAHEVGEDLFAEVASGEMTLESQVALLPSTSKQEAYALAVAVCTADGLINADEADFLGSLHKALGLDQLMSQNIQQEANTLATTPLDKPIDASGATESDPLESLIVNHAMIAGALQLLPHGLATLAVVPLQSKMVYHIAEKNGHKPSRENITDLLTVVGVGLTSQVVGGIARGLFRGVAGKALGGLAGTAANAALSFATTYALGGVAKRYYEQGRKLSGEELKQVFTERQKTGQELFVKYQAQIQEKAQTLKGQDLAALLRGDIKQG